MDLYNRHGDNLKDLHDRAKSRRTEEIMEANFNFKKSGWAILDFSPDLRPCAHVNK